MFLWHLSGRIKAGATCDRNDYPHGQRQRVILKTGEGTFAYAGANRSRGVV
jgi:hypothetical protein